MFGVVVIVQYWAKAIVNKVVVKDQNSCVVLGDIKIIHVKMSIIQCR